MGLSRIRVRIDELVLHGFPPAHRERIADAVRAELARQLADDAGALGHAREGAALDRLRVAPVRLAHGEAPERAGSGIGRAVADSLRAEPGR